MNAIRAVAVIAAAALGLAACGSSGESTPARSGPPPSAEVDSPVRSQPAEEAEDAQPGSESAGEAVVVEIEMSEFAYAPDPVAVPMGVPVRLVFRNVGAVAHEAMLGSMHEQMEFEASHGHQGGHHGDVLAVTVDPGETRELETVFDRAGTVLIGCHLPGHWDAGMVASLEVG